MTARVLWVTKGLGLGGAERLLTLTAARIDPTRFEVEVAYLLPWKDAFVPELERTGVRTICLGGRRGADPRWTLRLRRLLRTGNYALVHTHSPVPAAAARLLSRSPTRLIHTEHNVWDRYRRPTYIANALTYPRNDAVIAVSDGVADSIRRPRWVPWRYPPVETLLHGVEPDSAPRGPEARAAARRELGLDESVPVIGTVANFTPKKDHAGLLEALDRIRVRIPEAMLLLVGSGPLEEALRADATARNLDGHVRFLGSRDDVPTLLPALDVFVLGSRFEGLPISLLEAMAAEVACVSTGVGGIPEVITDGVEGRLVPVGDPSALGDAIIEVLDDRDERAALAAAGRARVEAEFSIQRAVRRTEEIYTDTLTEVPSID
jgi:glycosyltransferase involved in cell wall biosynthesis